MPTTVPRPRGAGHSERPPPPRAPIVTTTRMSARLPTLVGVSKQEGRHRGGLGGQGSDKGRRGLWEPLIITRGQGHVADSFSGVPCGQPWDVCLPQSVHVLGWLGTWPFIPTPVCLGGEVSMQSPPRPTPSGIGGHPHRTCLRLHTPGEGPRCTHCKKCTFRGRGCGGGMERPRGLQERGSSGVSIH